MAGVVSICRPTKAICTTSSQVRSGRAVGESLQRTGSPETTPATEPAGTLGNGRLVISGPASAVAGSPTVATIFREVCAAVV